MTRNPIDENWDEGLAGIREMSDKLKGLVSTLVAEGWTEEQARELIVAAFVSNARGVR